jgi:hypothetical protein
MGRLQEWRVKYSMCFGQPQIQGYLHAHCLPAVGHMLNGGVIAEA